MKHSSSFKIIAAIVTLSIAILVVPGCHKDKSVTANNFYLRDFDYEAKNCFYPGDTIMFKPHDYRPGTTYLWQFGDGSTSTDRMPQYAYTQPGAYTVRLLRNNDIENDTEKVINILPPLRSAYTFSMNGIWYWNGTRDEEVFGYYLRSVTDSPVSIQVMDSGTVLFMGYTMRLDNFDTVNLKVLRFRQCSTASSLSYYYEKDSLSCRMFWPVDRGGGVDLNLQSTH